MREMKDSGIEWIGEIPATWEVHPIYYYFSERKNRNSLGRENNLLSLSYGNIIPKDINSIGGLLPESFNTYNIVESGDIIIRSTDLQNDKRSLRTGLVNEHGIITSAYIALKAIRHVNTAYFHYLLHAFDVMKVFYNMGNGVRQGLNFSEFAKLMVFEPPLEEQDAIVNFLDRKCAEIDTLTSDIETQIETLEQYKRSVITKAVTKGLDPDVEMKDSGVEWITEIPINWMLAKVKYIAAIYGRIGFRGYTQQDMVDIDEGAITLSPSNFKDMKMDYNKCAFVSWEKYYESPEIMIHNGDILFVKTGSTYGKSVRVKNLPKEATINPQLLVFKEIKIDKQFFLYLLQTSFIRYQIEAAVVGGTIPTISQEKIGNFVFMMPPIFEQQSIADFLDRKCAEIDSIIADKRTQLDTLAEYKKSLIYEYVTGKKEVPSA